MSATQARSIRDLVQKLAGTYNKDIVNLIVCTVNSVNGFTCDCTPISGEATTTIEKVKLNAENNDGFLIVPKVDSTVIVANSNRNDYYVWMYSDIDKVVCVIDNNNSFEFSKDGFVWNGGQKGGLVNIEQQTTKINSRFTTIKNALASVFAGIDSSIASLGGTSTASATWTAQTVSDQDLNKNDFEDTKIKH